MQQNDSLADGCKVTTPAHSREWDVQFTNYVKTPAKF